MLWFEGSIPDAINTAKQRTLVFVVVITGEDEQSAQLMSSWEDESVSEAALNCCVAIKLDAKSETCVQFSQIYPVVCVPSSFFIGENGIPLEVIAGSVSAQELMKRIHRVKQMHVQQIRGVTVLPETNTLVETTPPNNTDTQSAVAAATAVPVRSAAEATEPAAGPAQGPLSSPVDDGSLSATASAENASSDAEGDETLDAKVQRLTKKLEERREQKRKGEEETEIKKEIDRRKVWKDMQDFKKKQEDDKTKRLLEERNREKAEEKAARERVKLQIAMDRADRAARYAKTQEEEKAAREAILKAREVEQEARKETLVRQRSTIARIQFRLPDGSFFTNQFPSQSTLQDAQHFAAQEVRNRYSNFSLATMFPRREFTSEDMSKTLLELELVPSASIVLLPHSGRPTNTVIQSSGGGIWAILGTIIYPLLAVWRFLSSFLFTTPPPGPASQGPSQQSSSYTNPSSSSDKTKRETLSKHSLEKQPKDFKKDGKICSLRTQEDSEDDNNTWNGNSTQQM
ncbi:UBX domain-containing protein 4 isoform X1 [Solea senegalensis]|uniref:UBX domain-containing protein 4 n=2 Tax=Solea senegalensis TaxID=28829 RepID=A0AAV6RGD7_SOLSE|nr:UBX domain-containing protein 4 [Solea senegalensis]KAG7503509.1 UBX domain-containing protein 4 isoform X1 [Solea senegalensis]